MITVIDKSTKSNLGFAISFADFYDLYEFGPDQHQNALSVIERAQIIPISDELALSESTQSGIDRVIQKYRDQTMRMDRELRPHIGSICVAVMQILSLQFQAYKMRQQPMEAKMVSQKCDLIYSYFNNMESAIKPPGAGDDTAQTISKYYYRTR